MLPAELSEERPNMLRINHGVVERFHPILRLRISVKEFAERKAERIKSVAEKKFLNELCILLSPDTMAYLTARGLIGLTTEVHTAFSQTESFHLPVPVPSEEPPVLFTPPVLTLTAMEWTFWTEACKHAIRRGEKSLPPRHRTRRIP